MVSMADEGSFLLPASFHPPVLPARNAASSGGLPGSSAWVFLDSAAYIAERRNGTFAETTTRTGQSLGVSFWLADPPAVSHLCIHFPDMKVTDLLDEPLVVCAGKDVAVIRVAYTYGARPLESLEDLGVTDLDYFVYRAHTGKPTLRRLPDPKPLFFEAREVGFLPSVDGDDFLMAVIRPRHVQLQYDLHIFSSKTNRWTTKLALLEPPSTMCETEYLVHQTDKVITLEGGTLGWVDLWRGILLCDVLASAPVLRYVQFPEPAPGNLCRLLETPARAVRDVTYSNGFVKFIEIEERYRVVVPATSPNDLMNRDEVSVSGLETEDTMSTCTTESSVLDGWTAVTWISKTTDHWSEAWRKDCRAYVSESSVLSVLKHSLPEDSSLENLVIAGPVWSMHGGDVCYLMAKAALEDKIAWAMAIDMRKNTLEGLTSFSAERDFFFKLAYHPFALSYPNMTSDDSTAAADVLLQGREDCRNDQKDPNNTMVLVEGLDSFITENQLKGILSMFGGLRYLKFHEKEGYGLVQFASRSCAEEAISTLNGAQIGRRGIRLSWKHSSLNKQAPQHKLSGRNGASYHPYERRWGVHSHSNTAARSSNAHEAPVAIATHCSTPWQHQTWIAPVAADYNTNKE